jgi:integrase
VFPSGKRSWIVRTRVGGKTAKLTLGDAAIVPLADARERARGELRQVATGLDPRQERRARLAASEQRRKATVAAAVALWLAKDQAGNRTADEVRKTMEKHVLLRWGEMPLADVRKRHVLELLDQVSETAPVRVNRVLAYVKRFLAWCAGRDMIEANPAASVEKPARETRRDRVLTDDELRIIWHHVERRDGPFAAAVRLLVLTGCRRAELFEARRADLAENGAAIRVPAERSKNGEARLIWLSEPARRVVDELPDFGPDAFLVSADGQRMYSAWSGAKKRLDDAIAASRRDAADPSRKGKTLTDVEREKHSLPSWRLHDLRRTVATGMQRLGVKLEVIETVLGHVSGTRAGIVGTYQKHRFEQEAREALEAWARHLRRITEGTTAEVVELRERR